MPGLRRQRPLIMSAWPALLVLLGLVCSQAKNPSATALNLRALVNNGRSSSSSSSRSSTAAQQHPETLTTGLLVGSHVAKLRGGASSGGSGGAISQTQKEKLFEAYNELHSLAQNFHKPFDSPAVLVVGQQSSGKSALIEALMGFQFNQVGGGTKTRRPIALRMQYNPDYDHPKCYLTTDSGKEEERTLAQIQDYIESENRRLERDPSRCFDPREIVVRVEYRFCPNMILIDTPGLIQAPRGKHLNPEQLSLANAAREAEQLVIEKMRCQDYIVLCVEDTADWKHASTRNTVMKVDPMLERTVLVTTKLDTKLPQFGSSVDLEDFLSAPVVESLYPQMLGGPYFTTVPSGRVGRAPDSEFFSNAAFVQACRRGEGKDSAYVSTKLGKGKAQGLLPNIGISRLRKFLETRVEECYRKNVARIVPLMQRELSRAETKLLDTESELKELSMENLKGKTDQYREHFSKALQSSIQGTIKAPPETYGESLEAEQAKAGSFVENAADMDMQGLHLMELEVGNTEHKLFGGAQYHRTLREFAYACKHLMSPLITEDEIANAAGVGDMHDGVNFMRAACVIAVEKARISFEPLLDSLRLRTTHVMKRLFVVVEYMLEKEGHALGNSHQRPFSFVVRRIFEEFVEKSVESCLSRCRDDLRSITRFVTWDLHERAAGALHRSLPDANMVQVYSLAVESSDRTRRRRAAQQQQQKQQQQGTDGRRGAKQQRSRGGEIWEDGSASADGSQEHVVDQWDAANSAGLGGAGGVTKHNEYFDLMQLMEEASCTRNAKRTSAVVSSLVRHIMGSWREHFSREVAMKFNCFFLMPFVDDFPFYLRQELDKVCEGDMSDFFDITETRNSLNRKRDSLIKECKACHQIQTKFDEINGQLSEARMMYDKEVEGAEEEDSLQDLDEQVNSWDYDLGVEDLDNMDVEESDFEEGGGMEEGMEGAYQDPFSRGGGGGGGGRQQQQVRAERRSPPPLSKGGYYDEELEEEDEVTLNPIQLHEPARSRSSSGSSSGSGSGRGSKGSSRAASSKRASRRSKEGSPGDHGSSPGTSSSRPPSFAARRPHHPSSPPGR